MLLRGLPADMYATAFRVLAALLQHAPTLRLALPPPPAALPQLMCVRNMMI